MERGANGRIIRRRRVIRIMTKKRQMGWKGGRKKKDGGVSHPLQKSGARGGEAEGQRQHGAWSMEHGVRSVERQHGARSVERQQRAWSIEHGVGGMETEARIKGGRTW